MKRERIADRLPLLGALRFPGMLYASTIRSTVPRARRVEIERHELPSGYRCVAPTDVRAENLNLTLPEGIPIFADDTVAYKGEALGLIIGPDAAICDELAKEAVATYEEEEPEFEWESFSSSQIAFRYTTEYGQVDQAFDKNPRVDRAVYRNGIFDHHYSEPMGAIANWEYDKMAIYCASQWPAHVRRSVAAALKVSEEDIVVRPTELGRALDGRLWFPSIVASQAAIAAKHCGKPICILYTREEDYLRTPKQARSAITIKTAIDEQGKLLALDARIIINIGAYNPMAEELVHQATAAITGIYQCPAVRIEAYAIRSNIIPLGAMGSMGSTHAFFTIEAHLNHLAKKLGKAPAEIKALNILTKGSSNFGSRPLDYEIPFAKIHHKLEKISDYRRKYASYELVKKRDPGSREGIIRGIALTVGYQTGRSFCQQGPSSSYTVETTLDRDLGLVIKTQAAIGSESLMAMWRKTAAGILSIPEQDIHFDSPDSDVVVASGPMTLSRGSSLVTKLIDRTCRSIQKRRFRESLPLSAKAQTKALKAVDDTGAPALGAQLFDSASWCGTAVEIEVDPLNGAPKPIAVWMVVEAGKIVDEALARASLRASAISALSLCTGGDFNPHGGEGEQYLHERRLSLPELPYIDIEFIDADRSVVPRGLGELPFITVPAAFYSALTQALGIDPRQLPLGGSEILKLLETS